MKPKRKKRKPLFETNFYETNPPAYVAETLKSFWSEYLKVRNLSDETPELIARNCLFELRYQLLRASERNKDHSELKKVIAETEQSGFIENKEILVALYIAKIFSEMSEENKVYFMKLLVLLQ